MLALIKIRNIHYIRLWNACNSTNSTTNVRMQISAFCSNSKENDGSTEQGDVKNMSSDVDDEKQKLKSSKKDEASIRLNQLLASMSNTNKKIVQTAVPGTKIKKVVQAITLKVTEDRDQEKPVDSNDKSDIVKITQKVATELGGNVKRTESELLTKLLSYASLNSQEQSKPKQNKSDLSTLMAGMKIDKSDKSMGQQSQQQHYEKRSQFVRKTLSEYDENNQKRVHLQKPMRKPRQQRDIEATYGSVNLFGEQPLGIFIDAKSNKLQTTGGGDSLLTWHKLHENEIKLSVTHPPSNYFQKMALWTEQGKIWKFPIDNEQGLDAEAQVYFTDHIFTEQYIEDWCPKNGPIRNFMELVCVGLSKNPYLSVDEKKAHIQWFRDYFEQKKEILKNVIIENEVVNQQKELNK